jgi:hypothetical protein
MTIRTFLLGTTMLVAAALTSAAHAQSVAPLKVKSVEFTATPAPANSMEMAAPYTRSEAVVTLADGTRKTYPLRYQVLHRSGDYVHG